MPSLSELTDYEVPAPEPAPASIPRVYIDTSEKKPEKGLVQSITDKLLGLNGEERYQLWPEKVVREGLSAAGDAMQQGTVAPGLRREDFTDIPAPDMPTKDSTALGKFLNVAPVAASPQDKLIEQAGAISALAGTGGLAGGAEGSVLNATPSLRPALKYKDKLYKGKPGQEHQDVIPQHLYPEFQQMAMSGEDISHYNFGFVNDKGHFLDRESALKYGIDNGLIDPQAGKYGALTSTLMADSSKPGMAIEAIAKADPFFSALEHNVKNISQTKMNGDAWLGTLSNKPGVKPEELQWTGLKDFLESNKGKPVTKEQIESHLASNKVELKEVNKADKIQIDPVVKFIHESLGPASKHITDAASIADARKFNSHFRETTKGMSDEEVLNAARASEKLEGVGDSKYHSYQLPGAENYREMLLTLPEKPKLTADGLPQNYHLVDENAEAAKLGFKIPEGTPERWSFKAPDMSSQIFKTREEAVAAALRNAKQQDHTGSYRSSHWDEPNILAHVRMNDRTIDGKKSLHLEEIQSDWHQQGRDKGYKSDAGMKELDELRNKVRTGGSLSSEEGTRMAELAKLHTAVPDAPFKKTWHELALKRMIREAAEKGYDRLSWTPGEAQAARYDLSKSIGSLKATPIMDQHGLKYEIRATNSNGTSEVLNSVHTADELPNIVGKEMAKKIIDETEGKKPVNFKGLDLKVGGEGMKGFYDSIIPKAVEKLGKEHGVKVKQANLTAAPKYEMKNPILNKEGKEIISVYKDGTFMADMEKSEAKHYIETKQKSDKPPTAHYIDIPQSLRDTAVGKGFPLFSRSHMFTPIAHDPFNEKKK